MLTFVIPTLGRREEAFKRMLRSLENQTNPTFDLVVVSQENHECVESWLATTSITFTHVKMDVKGLSKARNEAWPFIKGDLVTFSDDDCWYPSDTVAYVHKKMVEEKNEGCCFQIFDPFKEESYKTYSKQLVRDVSGRMLFRKSSIELFFKTEAISSLRFHESFGLGGKYPSGEENLFLHHFVSNGNQLTYFPKVIVYHEKPSQESRLTESQLISKGPLFKTMYNTPIGFVLLTALFLKKSRYIKNPASCYSKAVKELIVHNEK
ncbi:glycosyltransferase family 2 protein [Shouchella patagoniensis]|uniref:glycosyltransferase family 2 protein n=1 Tax=Shouchella patagoniensis TaxID=228576 RepID=UPI000994F823|nr:glycosyltransferase family A protein [Shouchella patagoniensis]